MQRLCGGHVKEEVLLKLPFVLGMLHDICTSSIAPASWLEHLQPREHVQMSRNGEGQIGPSTPNALMPRYQIGKHPPG